MGQLSLHPAPPVAPDFVARGCIAGAARRNVDERPEVADGDLCIAVPEAASRAVERFFPPLGLPKVRVFLTRGNF